MVKLTAQLNYSILLGASVILSSVIAPTIAHAESTPGQDGRSGESKTIYLSKPEVIQLDLSGTDGQAGRSYRSVIGSVIGSLVESAFNNEHDRKKHHNSHKPSPIAPSKDSVTMANGEAGRNGGSGGDGGNGGSLTVYYNNLSDLKTIQVNSKPGRGAAGGSGERGSPGQKCSHHYQNSPQPQPHHPNSPKKADEQKAPSCIDGKRGADGSNGSSGRDGTIGRLTLIRGQQPIAVDFSSVQIPLSTLLQAAPTLSLNRWDQKAGAIGLLSQGSVIDDQYREYRDRLEKTAKISWNATAPIAEYGNQTATLSLQNTGKLDLAFSDPQLWTIVQESEAPVKPNEKPTTLLAINSIIHQREVTQLTPGITDKRDRAFTLNVIDTAGKSGLLDTQFRVRVRSVGSNGRWGGFSNSTTEYDGVVPANLVTRDYNRFVLNLGALPVDADVFKTGAELEVEITATRSLGTRSAQKTIDWSGTVY